MIYASKASATIGIFKHIASKGLGLDVVSGGEIFTALKSSFDTQKIYFHGNNKSIDELKLAIDHQIKIVIDNLDELENIRHLSNDVTIPIQVMFRLKPEIEAHTHEYIKTGHIDEYM